MEARCCAASVLMAPPRGSARMAQTRGSFRSTISRTMRSKRCSAPRTGSTDLSPLVGILAIPRARVRVVHFRMTPSRSSRWSACSTPSAQVKPLPTCGARASLTSTRRRRSPHRTGERRLWRSPMTSSDVSDQRAMRCISVGSYSRRIQTWNCPFPFQARRISVLPRRIRYGLGRSGRSDR